VISRAAPQHEVCPGDGPRFHYQAKQGTSCPAAGRSLLSPRLLSAEIAAICRLQLVTQVELAARLNIFTLRDSGDAGSVSTKLAFNHGGTAVLSWMFYCSAVSHRYLPS
jgi:hypothetical protein